MCNTYVPFSFLHALSAWIHTLSLHDALPISEIGLIGRRRSATIDGVPRRRAPRNRCANLRPARRARPSSRRPASGKRRRDRKSTRLNSSHLVISYAVFCLKKKRKGVNTDGTF